MGRVKVFYNSPIVECVSEYIFLIWKKKKAWDKKQMKLKNKREHLWKIWRDTMISFKNLLCLLLTYLIESWISPGCSYEFNVVFMQREKSQHLFATTYEVHTFKNNNKKIIKRQFCLFFYFFISVYLQLQICHNRNTHLRHSSWWEGDELQSIY